MINNRRSVAALILYIIGMTSLIISLFMLMDPSMETYGPSLVGLLLSFVILGVARSCELLSRIRDILEGRG